MDWSALAFGFSLAERKRKKAEQERLEKLHMYRSEITDGIFALQQILLNLFVDQLGVFDMEDEDTLQELAPLFPMAEILSMQGHIGPQQELYLQDHFNISYPRYNLGQFVNASVNREGIYPEWNDLAGLNQEHCGKIWRTLIEVICRQRAPEVLQQIVDLLGKILYNFWFLECPDMAQAQICFGRIISDLNLHCALYQKQPYLYSVILLQVELAASFGGEPADYLPQLDDDGGYLMDGDPGFKFFVIKKADHKFLGVYAVRAWKTLDDPDLIWEIPAGGADPVVFYSES